MRYTYIYFSDGRRAIMRGWCSVREIVNYCNKYHKFNRYITPYDIAGRRFRLGQPYHK